VELNCIRSDEELRYIRIHPHEELPFFQFTTEEGYLAPLPRSIKLLLALAFFIPLGVYFITMARMPAGENGAELAICVHGLGLPQSPACPCYLLLAYLFCVLFPVGDFIFRLNFLSVVMGALTCWLTALILYRLFRSVVTSLFLSLVVAFSVPLWQAAVATSIMPMALFFFSLCLYFLLQWYASRRETTLLWALLSLSAMVTTHPFFLLLIPALLVFLWVGYRESDKVVSHLLWSVLFLGFLVMSSFLFLPLLSWANPPYNRPGLHGFQDTVVYILGKPYWPILSQSMVSIGMASQNCLAHLDNLQQSLWPSVENTILKIALYILVNTCAAVFFWKGAFFLWREHKPLFYLLASACTAMIFTLLFFSAFPLPPDVTDSLPKLFLLLVYLAILLSAPIIAKLFTLKRRPVRLLVIGFAVLLLIGQLFTHFPACSYRDWNFPQRYVEAIWKEVPACAIIVPGCYTTSSYLLYDQLVLGNHKGGHIFNPYGKDHDLSKIDSQFLAEAILQKYPHRSLYLCDALPPAMWHRYHLEHRGLTWHVALVVSGKSSGTREKRVLELPLFSPNLSYNESKLLSECYLLQGMTALEHGEIESP
jgi:4-amino-4-deoxy-L-arabinose transferase-like glycosyltransferase